MIPTNERIALLGVKSVFNTDDLALFTGLSKSHIYKLVWAKKIPYYKSDGGKQNYFKKEEIERWLLARRVSTTEEIEQKAIAYNVSKKGGLL